MNYDGYAPADDECWIRLGEAIIESLSDCYSNMFYVGHCKSQEEYWKNDEPFYAKRMLLLKQFKKSPCSSMIREDKMRHGLNERLRKNMRKCGIRWEAKT